MGRRTLISVWPDRDDRKALLKGQKRIDIVHRNAGMLMCLFVNIIHQTGVLVSVFPGIP